MKIFLHDFILKDQKDLNVIKLLIKYNFILNDFDHFFGDFPKYDINIIDIVFEKIVDDYFYYVKITNNDNIQFTIYDKKTCINTMEIINKDHLKYKLKLHLSYKNRFQKLLKIIP